MSSNDTPNNMELDEELIGALFGELDDALDSMRATTENVLENGAFEDSINSVFRRVHSIKSNLRMVFVNDLADYTHDVENMLTDIREGLIEAPPAFFPMLLLVMTEICELAKTTLNGGHIDEPFMALLTAVEKLDMGNTEKLAASSLVAMQVLEPDDESGFIARLKNQ